MANFILKLVLTFTLIVAPALTSPTHDNHRTIAGVKEVDPALDFIGATSTKEFYITNIWYRTIVYDFAWAVNHGCSNTFGMQLVAVENLEEFSVIDTWFRSNYDNTTSSPAAWTSAFQFGSLPLSWATGGKAFDLTGVTTSAPWPAGGGGSPMYSWNKCLTIYLHCNRSEGSPPGCWPLQTEFYYADCTAQYPVICQKAI